MGEANETESAKSAAGDAGGEPSGPVLLAVRDLFFRVKLETGLRSLGIPFRTIGRGAPSAALDPPPALVIVDLSDAALDPLGLTREIRARRDLGSVPVIGFAAHEDRELRDAARAAGCSLVVSRSRLSGALPDVLEPFHAALGRRGAGRSPSGR